MTSSGGVRKGENPGGNFSAERLSATKTLVNIALFLGNVYLKICQDFWHCMSFVCKIVESTIAYCIDCF